VTFISETTSVAVAGRQPVVCGVKNAAAVGSDVGAAVGVDVGPDEGLGEDALVADGDPDDDGDGWVETAGAHTQALKTRTLVSAIVRSAITIPADGLPDGARAGGASSDHPRLAA
jgi:hypothetical protein